VTSISVIIATYGEEHWSKLANDRAVPSCEGQGADWIVTRHQPNGTRSSSLNQGAADTEDDWLCFLDADDELAPGYVGAMRRAVEQNTSDGTRVLLTPAVLSIRGGRTGTPGFFEQPPRRQLTLRDYNWLVIGTLIHRDLFWEVGGFEEYPHGFEDFALWSKCYRVGARVVKVPDAVYRYHHNPQSLHRQGWRDRKAQTAMHQKVIADLDAWELARA
jgi:glycosyltransferase involved in cell wall biosynthesis